MSQVILTERAIRQKIKRIAYEILEQNHEEASVTLVGINNAGLAFARFIEAELREIGSLDCKTAGVRLNPAAPTTEAVEIDLTPEEIAGRSIIVVDDVANTGRTIFYACRPFFTTLPKRVQVAVLVDRKHKFFPVEVNYVGLALATTLRDHIDVDLEDMVVRMT